MKIQKICEIKLDDCRQAIMDEETKAIFDMVVKVLNKKGYYVIISGSYIYVYAKEKKEE